MGWVLEILSEERLINGRTVLIDATTMEANAALKSIVRRDSGQRYTQQNALTQPSHFAPISSRNPRSTRRKWLRLNRAFPDSVVVQTYPLCKP